MLIDNPFATIERRFNRIESLLEKILEEKSTSHHSADKAALLSRKEAAQYLNVSLGTLRTLTTTGQIQSIQIGRNPKYSLSDLDSFINSQK